jgi:hypothetical protein
MATPLPSGSPARDGDNCPMLSATARFLIWATRNTRKAERAQPERPTG